MLPRERRTDSLEMLLVYHQKLARKTQRDSTNDSLMLGITVMNSYSVNVRQVRKSYISMIKFTELEQADVVCFDALRMYRSSEIVTQPISL